MDDEVFSAGGEKMKKFWGAVACVFILAVVLTGGSMDPGSAWTDFESRQGSHWVTHRNELGWVRSLYGWSLKAAPTAESAASSFLRDAADVLGIDRISDLRLASVERTKEGADIRYEQTFSGLRVSGGEVTIHTGRDNRVVAATSGYRSIAHLSSAPLAAEFQAGKTALMFLGKDGAIEPQGLWIVVDNDGFARVAWRFQGASDYRRGSYLLFVDAADTRRILRIYRTFAEADGDGSVYLENSVVTPATSIQPFKYMDASKQLKGKFVKTYNANFEHWYFSTQSLAPFTTASDPNRHYIYATDDARFSEAMAYFHVNKVHDQWQSFGFNKLNVTYPVIVNVVTPSGLGFDNAFYSRYANASKFGALVFGAGNKLQNFGLDADVYYHEYGHAVLDRAKPGFFETIESNYAGAFHEAFGDISAAAITGNSKLAEFALRFKAGNRYIGRDLDNHRTYPKDVILPGTFKSEAHYAGEIVGGTWWDLQKSIGRPVAQRILYRSLAMIPNEMTFFDLRDAMLQADTNINGSANHAAIQDAFTRHGLSGADPGQPGSVAITSVKTALVTFTRTSIKIQLKTNFKAGDTVSIFAGYKGTNLTPGYNLIAQNTQLSAPSDTHANIYPYFDEVANGSHTGKQGAWIIDIDTIGAKPGKYTLTFQTHLGGTSGLLPEKSVSFSVAP